MKILQVVSLFACANAISSRNDRNPMGLQSTDGEFIPDQFLVKFKDGSTDKDVARHYYWLQTALLGGPLTIPKAQHGSDTQLTLGAMASFGSIPYTYSLGTTFQGYAFIGNVAIAESIRQQADIEFVEPEGYIYSSRPLLPQTELQDHPPWGLGRVSHQKSENLSWPYTFSKSGLGQGVDVYVLDTGVYAVHQDFDGRVVEGLSAVPNERSVDDYLGHGTHCAGTIGGSTFGIAKQASIVSVKVLGRDGVGGQSLLAKGMEWAAKQHLLKIQRGEAFNGSVFSMSLGGARSEFVNRLATRIIELGIHLVAAAGNEGVDACTMSPASSPNVTTVGAVDPFDVFPSFSNWGSCVDLNGPGVYIRSAGIENKTSTSLQSGTSMAAPHVAGVIASLLSRQARTGNGTIEGSLAGITPFQLQTDLISIASHDLIANKSLPDNTTNVIVYSGGAESNYSKIIRCGGWPSKCT